MTPAPTPVVIALLSALPAVTDDTDRVSVRLLSPLPALRVSKVGDAERPSSSSIAPLFQVEVWASDELDAERIAWAVADAWPTSRPEVIGDAYVHGRWVDVNPHPLPNDPEGGPSDRYDSDLARYVLTVGIRISGVNP